jgi:hypothetical protein
MDRVKHLMIGFLCGALFFSGLTYAATSVGIEVYFRPVQYFFDGVKKMPSEGSQGFIYKNKLYVPLRFLSESLDKAVFWDEPNTSVYVGIKPEQTGAAKSQTDVSNIQVFPQNNPWNTDITHLPVHTKSSDYLKSIGLNTGLHADFGTMWEGAPIGIPYSIVGKDQPRVKIQFTDYGDESDPGPYPVPLDAPIEGGPNASGDRHVLVIDRDNQMLYELYNAHPTAAGWTASNGAKWDLTSNALRTTYWTSADAAGLPIFPGLVRYDEAASGEINHAIRFTVNRTQKAFILPATHYASSHTETTLPPMGLRLRLRAEFDISKYSKTNQAILRAMKTYGLIVADNGSNLYISGAPDARWDDDDLHELGKVKGSDFEAVFTGEIQK